MKHFIILTSITLSLLVMTSSFASSKGELKLILRPEKPSFILGEVVKFNFELKNNGKKDLVILNSPSPMGGYLSVWVSKDGKTFEKYDHTRWGIKDSGQITTLRPNESVLNDAMLFWNNKPKFSNSIAPDVLERAAEGKIKTDFVFPVAGTYYIKAGYSVHLSNETEALRIESSPVKIYISEPTGKDLEVWNKIKDNGDIAYFIQEGEMPISSYKTEQRNRLRREIEQIIEHYPDSLIVTQMEKSMQSLRTTEEKIKAATERLKRPLH